MSAHNMPCPHCQVPLVMSERQGVEIDYCPQCRGVWLDRGELDKIIERAGREATAAAPPPPQSGYQQPRQPHYDDRDRHRAQPHYGYPKRRKSFLEDLFD